MVKCFLSKIISTDEVHQYEDTCLKRFDLAIKNTSMKVQMVGLIQDHLISKLQENEISVLKSASIALNSEGLEKDNGR